jgi:hypothetical protein
MDSVLDVEGRSEFWVVRAQGVSLEIYRVLPDVEFADVPNVRFA